MWNTLSRPSLSWISSRVLNIVNAKSATNIIPPMAAPAAQPAGPAVHPPAVIVPAIAAAPVAVLPSDFNTLCADFLANNCHMRLVILPVTF